MSRAPKGERRTDRAASDRLRAIEVCREIRDSATSTHREKLEAVKLLKELGHC